MNTWRFDRPHAEHGARLAARAPAATSKPYVVAQVDLEQRPAALGRERAGVAPGLVGVLADAEPEVEAVGVVAELAQELPEAERVLAARHRDEDALARCDHVEVLDRAADLLTAVAEEAVGAEARVVPADVDHRGLAAAPALHAAPPETTGRISTTSSSRSRSSWVASVSLRITSTDSGMTRGRAGAADVAGRGNVELAPRVAQDDPHDDAKRTGARVKGRGRGRRATSSGGHDLEDVAGFDHRAVQDLLVVARDVLEEPEPTGHDPDDEPRREPDMPLRKPVVVRRRRSEANTQIRRISRTVWRFFPLRCPSQ